MSRHGKNCPELTEDNAAAEDDDGDDTVIQGVKLEKRYSAKTAAAVNLLDEREIPYDLILWLLEGTCFEDDLLRQRSATILIFMPGMGKVCHANDMQKRFGSEDQFAIHALRSTVSSKTQGAVLDVPRRGIHKTAIGAVPLRTTLQVY